MPQLHTGFSLVVFRYYWLYWLCWTKLFFLHNYSLNQLRRGVTSEATAEQVFTPVTAIYCAPLDSLRFLAVCPWKGRKPSCSVLAPVKRQQFQLATREHSSLPEVHPLRTHREAPLPSRATGSHLVERSLYSLPSRDGLIYIKASLVSTLFLFLLSSDSWAEMLILVGEKSLKHALQLSFAFTPNSPLRVFAFKQ